MEEITQEQKDNFLKWSEGNKYLYELFIELAKRGIKTLTSCGGHDNRQRAIPYITIVINQKSIPYLESIMGELQYMPDILIAAMPMFRVAPRKHEEAQSTGEDFRVLNFQAARYCCCELFYRITQALRTNEKVELIPQAKLFLERVDSLIQADREEALEQGKTGYKMYSLYNTVTSELNRYSALQKNIRRPTLLKQLAYNSKHDEFQRLVEEYRLLDAKYGRLQKTYSPNESISLRRIKDLSHIRSGEFDLTISDAMI